MTAHSDTKRSTISHLAVLFATSVLITLLLFYIDEGYYNFNWMTHIGNWFPFIIYVSVIFSGQLLFSILILKNYHGFGKTLLSVIGGTTIGILLLVFGIFTNW